MTLVALDDFAGTGWGVACKRLGIREAGVELMPEAVATREANGLLTIGRDVWEHIKTQLANQGTDRYYGYSLYIGSPPCQTFSMAGGGSGRRALDEVIGLIDSRAYLDVDALHEFGDRHDPRTALVLAPLVRIVHDVPTYVVLEQVPPVLPVWERYAVELRKWGYSVWVGILNAEQYGVPQTRKRAVLIARADGIEAAPPTPTHSRYYPRDPSRLDPGVLPWVSMAQALRWGMTARPSMTVTGGGGHGTQEHPRGGAEPFARDSREGMLREQEAGNWAPREDAKYFHPMTYGRRAIFPGDEPAPTIRGVQREMPETYEPHPNDAVDWAPEYLMSNYSTPTGGMPKPGSKLNRTVRGIDEPSTAITSKAESMLFVSNDRQAHSAVRRADEPAPTITAGHDSGNRVWVGNQVPRGNEPGEYQARSSEAPAPTVTGGSRSARWRHGETDELISLNPDLPATTVVGRGAIPHRGHRGASYAENNGNTTKVTVREASILQSYPENFMWDGVTYLDPKTGRTKPVSKTKQFLQVGNAVPPTLAEAILSVFL